MYNIYINESLLRKGLLLQVLAQAQKPKSANGENNQACVGGHEK